MELISHTTLPGAPYIFSVTDERSGWPSPRYLLVPFGLYNEAERPYSHAYWPYKRLRRQAVEWPELDVDDDWEEGTLYYDGRHVRFQKLSGDQELQYSDRVRRPFYQWALDAGYPVYTEDDVAGATTSIQVPNPNHKVVDFGTHRRKDLSIAKTNGFHFHLDQGNLETEIFAYSLLEGTGIAPKFKGLVSRRDGLLGGTKIVGFLLEWKSDTVTPYRMSMNADQRTPIAEGACSSLRDRLTDLKGIVQEDDHDGNCVVSMRDPGRAWLVDFEKARIPFPSRR